MKNLFLILIGLLLAGCLVSKEQKNLHEMKGEVFGSYYLIRYYGPLDPADFRPELEKFFQEFNNEFSTYRPDSSISSFNALPAHAKSKVSSSFIDMLKMAKKLHEETQGAFDPTLGPLIKAWGFSDGKPSTPSDHELKKALRKVGFKHVQWDEKESTVWKSKNGLELNVNAFAPGWAADLIGQRLFKRGIQDFMIDISGEILFKGEKPEGNWIAGIEKPSKEYAQGIQLAFKIKNHALSTSGDYRQYFDDNGVRKSHILDPRSGRPVAHKITSASVITDSAAAADAWSTAMMVLGPSGIEVAEKKGIKVFLLESEKPKSFNEVFSPSMKKYIEAHRF